MATRPANTSRFEPYVVGAAPSDEKPAPVSRKTKAARKAQAASGRRGRPAGRNPLPAGSLAAQLWDLQTGGFVLRPDAPGERRACTRAIGMVAERDPSRVYEIALWLALHHKGQKGTMRVLRIERTT